MDALEDFSVGTFAQLGDLGVIGESGGAQSDRTILLAHLAVLCHYSLKV